MKKFHIGIYYNLWVGIGIGTEVTNAEKVSRCEFLLEGDEEDINKKANTIAKKFTNNDEIGYEYYAIVTPWETYEENMKETGQKLLKNIV